MYISTAPTLATDKFDIRILQMKHIKSSQASKNTVHVWGIIADCTLAMHSLIAHRLLEGKYCTCLLLPLLSPVLCLRLRLLLLYYYCVVIIINIIIIVITVVIIRISATLTGPSNNHLPLLLPTPWPLPGASRPVTHNVNYFSGVTSTTSPLSRALYMNT